MVNVMGDALATGIMAHICRKDFMKEAEEVRFMWDCWILNVPDSGKMLIHFSPQSYKELVLSGKLVLHGCHMHIVKWLALMFNDVMTQSLLHVWAYWWHLHDMFGSQIPLICETKPMVRLQRMTSYQHNGCFLAPLASPGQPANLSRDVARLIQLEEGIGSKRKHKKSTHQVKKKDQDRGRNRDHCTIDMNSIETSV